MFDRITFNSEGHACIRHTAIPVEQILKEIANGKSLEQVIGDYPDLCEEDLKQALGYAASQARGRPNK